MTDTKTRYRDLTILFLINIVFTLFVFAPMLREHYSPDAYSVILDTDQPMWHTTNGRFIFGLFFAYSELIGLSVGLYPSIYTLIFIILSALYATRLTDIFFRFSPLQDRRTLLMCNSSILICFVNIFVIEWYIFSESMIMYAIAMVCSIEGAIIWLNKNTPLWKKSCISFIWFFIAINSYQAILAWYIAFGFLSILIPVSFNVRKQELIESVMLLGIGGANSILNQLIVKFLSVSNFLGDVPRSATLSLSKIFENLSAVLYDQKMIWLDGYGLITNGFLLLFVVVSFILSLTSVRKHTNGLFSILFTAFSLLISLSLVFLPQLVISSTVWLSHRTVTGIFVVIALMLCVAIVWGKAPQKNMAIVISVVVLLVNVICIFRVEKDVIYVNQKDHEEAYVILNHIREYEEKSGSKIEEICWLKDEHITYAYPNTYVSLNINQRAATIEWQAISILEVLSGRSFIHTTIVQEESDSLVQNRNWDSFVPEEQLIFDNNTLYYIVY